MKNSSLTSDEFDLIHPVLCYLHKGVGDKADKFLAEKFGQNALYLTKKWLKEQPTQKQIERERKRVIKNILKNPKYHK